jgi:hypothetical protein
MEQQTTVLPATRKVIDKQNPGAVTTLNPSSIGYASVADMSSRRIVYPAE